MDDKITNKKIKNAIAHLWNESEINAKECSKVCRQLALAEGAVCLFFLSNQGVFAYTIRLILFSLILFLVFDVIQYLTSAIVNYKAIKNFETNSSESQKNIFTKLVATNLPIRSCFILKFIVLFIATILLLCVLLNQ